ncbi:SAV_915 family protein [Streptomyces sp. NPDC048636]|uniref:SAV_915 family protein n=1 Tax=Streptomyces sp. NPDC048636 TaxID=3155762 RepID=UPI0034189F5A
MTELLYGDDSEPSERVPAGPLYVPVRPGPDSCAVRVFRTPLGGRTAVGFSSQRRLAAVLGSRQQWIRLAEPALRALTEPLGVTDLTVDPRVAGGRGLPPSRPLERRIRRPRDPQGVTLAALFSGRGTGALGTGIG